MKDAFTPFVFAYRFQKRTDNLRAETGLQFEKRFPKRRRTLPRRHISAIPEPGERHRALKNKTEGDHPVNIKQYVVDFAVMFAVVFVVNLVVTFLYSLIVHGSGIVDWESALRFGIMLGLILPWIRRGENKK